MCELSNFLNEILMTSPHLVNILPSEITRTQKVAKIKILSNFGKLVYSLEKRQLKFEQTHCVLYTKSSLLELRSYQL